MCRRRSRTPLWVNSPKAERARRDSPCSGGRCRRGRGHCAMRALAPMQRSPALPPVLFPDALHGVLEVTRIARHVEQRVTLAIDRQPLTVALEQRRLAGELERQRL